MATTYSPAIGRAIGLPTTEPRVVQVEAYLRLDYGTLDALTAATLAAEARDAFQAVEQDPATAARLAASMGLDRARRALHALARDPARGIVPACWDGSWSFSAGHVTPDDRFVTCGHCRQLRGLA